MTNPNTDIPILDDAAIAEIEARKVTDHHLENGAYIGCYILLSTSERDALIQTVRALKQANKDLAADTVRLTNESHKAHDRWKSELHQTELRLKAVTDDRNQILIERDDALMRLQIYQNDKSPANTGYEP